MFLYWRKGKPKFWFFFQILCIILSKETDYTLLLKENWILLQIHRIHINSIILPFTCMFIRKIRPMKIKLSLQIYHDYCFFKLEKYLVSCLGVIISFKHTFLLHIILLMSHQIFHTWIKPTKRVHLLQPSISMFQRAASQYSGAPEHCQRKAFSASYWDCGPHNEKGHNSTSTKAFVHRNNIPFP